MFAGFGAALGQSGVAFLLVGNADHFHPGVGQSLIQTGEIGHAQLQGPLAVEGFEFGRDIRLIGHPEDANAVMLLEEGNKIALVAVPAETEE
jgi:hypothetical protein